MQEEVLNKGLEILERIADKIGVTMKQMYEIYVVAQYYQSLAYLIDIIAGIFAFLIAAKMLYNMAIKKGESQTDALFAAIIVALLVMVLVIVIGYAITKFVMLKALVPQYTALKEMIGDVGSLVPKT